MWQYLVLGPVIAGVLKAYADRHLVVAALPEMRRVSMLVSIFFMFLLEPCIYGFDIRERGVLSFVLHIGLVEIPVWIIAVISANLISGGGGSGRWKRLVEKTSARLRALIAKIKSHAVPAPSPAPEPAG